VTTKLSRWAGLVAALLLTAGASQPPGTPVALADPIGGTALAAPQLVPARPAPGAALPTFAPAPVPDLDLDDGAFHRDGPAKVELTPNLFHQHQSFLGDGYTPNSTIQGEQTKRLRPTPGLNLSVPLN